MRECNPGLKERRIPGGRDARDRGAAVTRSPA